MTIPVKRRLTDIKFDHEGAAVALVGPHQGGPANGVLTLITKAVNATEEQVEKANEVTVQLSMVDFLRRFFGMYYEDSAILATALGYGTVTDSEQSWKDGETYEEYIERRASSISIMKGLMKAADVEKAASELTPAELLSFKKDQAMLEKAMSSASNDGDLLNESTTEEDDMDKIDKAEHEVLVEKAVTAATEVLKAQLSAKDEALEVAKATIKNFEDAQAAAKTVARVEALKAAGKGDERAVELEKSLASLDDEAFAEIVKDFAAGARVAAQSELLVEKGVDGQGAAKSAADATLAILQAKYAK